MLPEVSGRSNQNYDDANDAYSNGGSRVGSGLGGRSGAGGGLGGVNGDGRKAPGRPIAPKRGNGLQASPSVISLGEDGKGNRGNSIEGIPGKARGKSGDKDDYADEI